MDAATTAGRHRAAVSMTFWQSCFATAFAPTIVIVRPPNMMMVPHYYHNIMMSSGADASMQQQRRLFGATSCLFGTNGVGGHTPNVVQQQQLLPSSSSSAAVRCHTSPPVALPFRLSALLGVTNSKSSIESDANSAEINNSNDDNESTSKQQKRPRIAIIGGGIAGVTAANALVKKIAADTSTSNANIVVFEGDSEGGHRCVDFGNCEQPIWMAATARNANSLVPGAAMHVMSQRKTLLKIAKDTVREWYSEQVESFQHWLQTTGHVDYQLTKSIDNFDVVPPYFALHLFRCIGPSATWDERATFVTFLKNFLMTSVFSGEEQANERGKYIQQLAKSNRCSFLEAINNGEGGKALASKVGLGRGFLSLQRTSQDAIHCVDEGKLFGESIKIMPLEEAIKLEPRISNLPIANQLFTVHRIDDYTANSAVFVQDLVKKIKGRGVEYRCGEVGMIQDISQLKCKHEKRLMDSPKQLFATAPMQEGRFKITSEDGSYHNFDYVVLAAGVNTPLIARKLSVGDCCPTYPLRGYSLTVYTNHTNEAHTNDRLKNGRFKNLLNMPISIDDLYCSSVGFNQARMAGFGELVGYRDKAVDVPSLAPRVIARYAKSIFPESNVTEDTALQCFRPCSPDDIPIVGEVGSVPGLFMHTGHGSLGWTLCLATAECLAQALYDDIKGNEAQRTYQLPGDITVDREMLSPDRFL